jgi:hypothetical protein
MCLNKWGFTRRPKYESDIPYVKSIQHRLYTSHSEIMFLGLLQKSVEAEGWSVFLRRCGDPLLWGQLASYRWEHTSVRQIPARDPSRIQNLTKSSFRPQIPTLPGRGRGKCASSEGRKGQQLCSPGGEGRVPFSPNVSSPGGSP